MHPAVTTHFERLKARLASAELEALPSGAAMITVPAAPIPNGWNVELATIRFLAPVGYPSAQPDCFWVDPVMHLAGGAVPKNARMQTIPETPLTWFWFSWHVLPGKWNPNRDDLLTYWSVVMSRFEKRE